jgi:gamma-D-glutamyl-L-lysine dipeptidyl-peptidase
VSPLRGNPSHKSEMVSQLLFGEPCTVGDRSADHWVKVKCKLDGYEGWCQESHLLAVDEATYEQEKGLTRKWITEIEWNGFPMQVPMGSFLPLTRKQQATFKKNKLGYPGKIWDPVNAVKDKVAIKKILFAFLNTPYLWGGKSVFGTDCSGYTQTVFRFLNISLLRDAWQQATQGELVDSLSNAAFGDLAFFDNADGKITHVGILLNKHKIIHASGKVREDKITKDGIINVETKEQTHNLKMIRRYF